MVFLPLILAVVFFLPPVAMAIMVALVTMGAAYEFLRATGVGGYKRICAYVVLSAAVIPFAVYFKAQAVWFCLIVYLLTILLFLEAVLTYKTAREIWWSGLLAALFGGALIPLFLSVLVLLKMMDNGHLYVFMVLLITMISDSGAYFTGVYLGKHKGVLKVSPNKSAEGCVGSLVSAVVSMMIYGFVLVKCGFSVQFAHLLVYAVCGNFVTQLGDLAFSFIKRQNDIKDYGKLIPGHGGMLDRFDSMIFVAPVVYMLVTALPAF